MFVINILPPTIPASSPALFSVVIILFVACRHCFVLKHVDYMYMSKPAVRTTLPHLKLQLQTSPQSVQRWIDDRFKQRCNLGKIIASLCSLMPHPF